MNLPPRILSVPEFNTLTDSLRQQPVSAAVKGYGSAFSLFFGALTQRSITIRGQHASITEGVVSLEVEWDWRLEYGTAIQCGSSDSRPAIADGIAVLVGQSIVTLKVNGTIPELEVTFTLGHVLRTMAATHGQPAWSIQAGKNLWITPHEGQVCLSDATSTHSLTATHVEAFQAADAAASRWRNNASQPAPGLCGECQYYVRLDGEGALLDFGVCMAAASEYDGRVVHQRGGCARFKAADKSEVGNQ